MGKLESAQSAVYTLMDKLGPVREVLVQKDDDWESWRLSELVEHLHKFVDRNPIREGATEASGKQGWKKKGRWGDQEKTSSNNSRRMMQVFMKQNYFGNLIIWHYPTISNCHYHDCTAPLENWKRMAGLKNTMGSCGNS